VSRVLALIAKRFCVVVTARLDSIDERGDEAACKGGILELVATGADCDIEAREVRAVIDRCPVIGDVVDELGSRKEVEYAYRILEEGSSADRQLATYERTGDLKAVVDQLIAETADGL